MNLDGKRETEVGSVAINTGKKKPKAAKTGAKKAAHAHSGKKARKAHQGHEAKPKKKRRSKRRKNPAVDVTGTAMAVLGGAAGELIGTPAAHFAGKLVKKDGLGRGALRGAAGLAVDVGVSLLVGMGSPSMAKGMAGAGGSKLVRELLSGIAVTAKEPGLLTKAGFASLPLPDGVYVKDAQLFKKGAAGAPDQLLLGFNPRPYDVVYDDGSRESVSLLGGIGEDGEDALILDSEGEYRVLAGALGDLVEAEPQFEGSRGRMGDLTPAYQTGLSGDSVTGWSDD